MKVYPVFAVILLTVNGWADRPKLSTFTFKNNKNKILVAWDIKGQVVNGELNYLAGKWNCVLQIDNAPFTGTITKLQGLNSYSFTYKRDFAKAAFAYNSTEKSDMIEIKLAEKVLKGKIVYSENRGDLALEGDEKTAAGAWVFDPPLRAVKWTLTFDGKPSVIQVTAQRGSTLVYDFSQTELTAEQIIMFLFLEFNRLQG